MVENTKKIPTLIFRHHFETIQSFFHARQLITYLLMYTVICLNTRFLYCVMVGIY